MRKKRIVSLLLASLFIVSASACSKTKNEEKITYEDNAYKLTECVDQLKVIGRSEVIEDGITCDWSASGIEFTANCTGSVSVKLTATEEAYFTVYIDGKRSSERMHAVKGDNTLVIADKLSQGEHAFRFLKQTNSYDAICVLQSITLKGKLGDAPKKQSQYIEFIGDSITCGYADVEGAMDDIKNVGTPKYCDATTAFAFLTAEALKADYSLVGVSGAGITLGYANVTVPEVYPLTSWSRSMETKYSFDRVPDLVVINLGTNDVCKSADPTTFKKDTKQFINTIRKKYKDVPIIWVYNMMTDGYVDYIKGVLKDLGGEKADLYTISLPRTKTNGHPNGEEQGQAAKLLTKYIKELKILK